MRKPPRPLHLRYRNGKSWPLNGLKKNQRARLRSDLGHLPTPAYIPSLPYHLA